ncbi:MAG TPA: Lpg1974 family pore-forming outer membrane protein [Chlamydiales bacterium]|nr:Lpg1974 family pore-forming outer membrane protein [Chlamydiales bacterium]
MVRGWWVVFLLVGTLFAIDVYAVSCKKNAFLSAPEEGAQSQQKELPAGYNASASFVGRNETGVFFTADYIYWDWTQGSMKLGDFVDPSTKPKKQVAVLLSPGYASGVQVGAGYRMANVDGWNLNFQYTFYQNSASQGEETTNDQYVRYIDPVKQKLKVFQGSMQYHLNMKYNELWGMLQRPFYFGKRLLANFGVGLDSLWVVQQLSSDFNGLSGNNPSNATTLTVGSSTTETKEWSLGPRASLDASWQLGQGIAFLADIAGSLLYTRYYDLDYLMKLDKASGKTKLFSASLPQNVNTLTPILQFFLGLNWSRNLARNGYRLGLTAGYDFAAYWNFDMLNFHSIIHNTESANMYLHGLRLESRFDF